MGFKLRSKGFRGNSDLFMLFYLFVKHKRASQSINTPVGIQQARLLKPKRIASAALCPLAAASPRCMFHARMRAVYVWRVTAGDRWRVIPSSSPPLFPPPRGADTLPRLSVMCERRAATHRRSSWRRAWWSGWRPVRRRRQSEAGGVNEGSLYPFNYPLIYLIP